jgi:hypothetical protein
MLRTMKPGMTVLEKASSNLTDQLTSANLEEVCMQTDQSDSEAVVKQSLLVEAWEPPLL